MINAQTRAAYVDINLLSYLENFLFLYSPQSEQGTRRSEEVSGLCR